MAGASFSLGSTTITGRDITINNRQHIPDHQNLKHTIEDHTALGALHNSAGRYESPKCYPETRTAVLEDIVQWSQAADSKPVMWLRAAAGAGKTAIAQTLAERWDKEKLLAAAFFFSRTVPQCNEKTYLITTLAYQLQLNLPATRPLIEEVVSRDFGIFTKNMEVQMAELIAQPLAAVSRTRRQKRTRMIIIIDGLDECSIKVGTQDHEAQHREILGAISSAARPDLPVRFLIVSRPERQIRESFGRDPLKGLATEIDLSNAAHSSQDIRVFLDGKFVEIKQNNGILDPAWPSEDDIMRLVQIASSHFIYPSVAVRYIGRPRSNPRQSLKRVLDLDPRMRYSENPFSELDELYTLILRSVAPESLAIVKAIFSNICYEEKMVNEEAMEWLKRPIWKLFTDHAGPSIDFFERFYHLLPGDLNMHLTDLHSILHIPRVSSSDASDTLRFVHASFSDFLSEKSRSGEFFLDRQECLLVRQTQLTKHMMIYLLNGGHPSAIPYNQLTLSSSFAMTFTGNITPSPELTDGLEILDSGDKEQYRDYLRISEENGSFIPQSDLLVHQFPSLGERSFLRCAIREYLNKHKQ